MTLSPFQHSPKTLVPIHYANIDEYIAISRISRRACAIPEKDLEQIFKRFSNLYINFLELQKLKREVEKVHINKTNEEIELFRDSCRFKMQLAQTAITTLAGRIAELPVLINCHLFVTRSNIGYFSNHENAEYVLHKNRELAERELVETREQLGRSISPISFEVSLLNHFIEEHQNLVLKLIQKIPESIKTCELNLQNKDDLYHFTALSKSVTSQSIPITTSLLINRADPNLRDGSGNPPLSQSARLKCAHIVGLLLKYRANPNPKGFLNPLESAICYNNASATRLLYKITKLNEPYYYFNLALKTRRCTSKTIQFLLENNFNPSNKKNQANLLVVATDQQQFKSAEFFLRYTEKKEDLIRAVIHCLNYRTAFPRSEKITIKILIKLFQKSVAFEEIINEIKKDLIKKYRVPFEEEKNMVKKYQETHLDYRIRHQLNRTKELAEILMVIKKHLHQLPENILIEIADFMTNFEALQVETNHGCLIS